MSELDGSERTEPVAHPVVQGHAAIDEWFDSLLKIAREKAESERR